MASVPAPQCRRFTEHHSYCRHLLFSFTFVFISLACCNSGLTRFADAATHQDDVNGLLAILSAWGQLGSSILQSSGADPCGSRWTGIACDNSSPQRVTEIGLSGLGLVGPLPEDIKNLASLQSLDLSYNNLSGSLPKGIGQLSHLSLLVLQQNAFTGSIPAEYGQLTNLTYLYLNGNYLTGSLPHELGLLSKLYWLDVAFNRLSGPLPFSSDGNTVKAGLDNLTTAQHFHLNNNSFSGAIPQAMCHPGMNLIHLLLDSNQLSEVIPDELGQCSNLLILKLTNNHLVGAIPSNISRLSHLTELQVSQNSLSSPLPDLSNLTSLSILDISYNLFNEPFPSWLTSMKSLTNILMENSTVFGEIPAALFALPVLTTVRLSGNRINGTLDLSSATSVLTLISLQNNQISGLTLGKFNPNSEVLRLQGNVGVCSYAAYGSTYCASTNSSVSAIYSSPSPILCTNVCPEDQVPSPSDKCSCALPYQGVLIFRAPLFTTLDNATHFQELISYIADELKIDQHQVGITSAFFNAQNQLLVYISIFPNVGKSVWTRDEVIQLSYLLGNKGIHIGIFGPPLFIQNPYAYAMGGSSSGGGLSLAAKVGIGVAGGAVVLIIIVLVVVALRLKRRADKADEHVKSPFPSWPGSDTKTSGTSVLKVEGARYFSYNELKKASNNFSESNEIGSGGYGKVYKGITLTGEQVAIKRAQKDSMQGAAEFKNEIELLSRVRHKNVVSLVGFCYEQGEQMLVYEFMAKGNLRDNLLGRGGSRMSWQRRLMVALGSARGLAYLHELVTPPIIHRDIKSTNILLDERSIAKVADFGLSKTGHVDGGAVTVVETQVKGTLGYLDPEYYMTQQLSEKSDVYSYGVVLLELMTARAPIEHGKYIVNEVKLALDKGGLPSIKSLLDPRLQQEDLSELGTFLKIALSCVKDTGADRPSMGEVVKQLEELIGHEYPESGSSTMEFVKNSRKYPYGYDSASRESSIPSFPNSAINAQTS